MFYGKVTRSNRTDVPKIEDDDDFYDWEDRQDGRSYYRIGEDLFEVTPLSSSIDVHGGTLLIPPGETTEYRFLCYWYNGGASSREVIESAIESLLESRL